MTSRLVAIALVALLALAGCTDDPSATTATAPATAEPEPATETTREPMANDSRPTVTLRDENGTTLGSVSVLIADTGTERYTGLSDTESLAPDEGMLFVYNVSRTSAYVMRDMAFPLDILFVAANGTITRIHHAETEPNKTEAELTGYPGTGQYVLEVNRGYTNRTGVEVGDTVVVPDEIE